MFCAIANANSVVQHVTHIKNEILINGNMNVNGIVREKSIAGILTHVFVRIVSN